MSKKRFLSIVLSAVMILSLACSALAVGQSGRYIGNSTVNGSIYQTYYQVDAQTRTGIKSISVSGTLYEKGTFGTWQRVSNCSNTSTTSNCMASSNYNTKPGKSYKLEYGQLLDNLDVCCGTRVVSSYESRGSGRKKDRISCGSICVPVTY